MIAAVLLRCIAEGISREEGEGMPGRELLDDSAGANREGDFMQTEIQLTEAESDLLRLLRSNPDFTMTIVRRLGCWSIAWSEPDSRAGAGKRGSGATFAGAWERTIST